MIRLYDRKPNKLTNEENSVVCHFFLLRHIIIIVLPNSPFHKIHQKLIIFTAAAGH